MATPSTSFNSSLGNLLHLRAALLQDMKLHEESRLAVCLQFQSLSGSPHTWVVYCVQELELLAKLYTTLRYAASRRSYLCSLYVHSLLCV